MKIVITLLSVEIVRKRKVTVPVMDDDVEPGYYATVDVPLLEPYTLVTCKISALDFQMTPGATYIDNYENAWLAVDSSVATLITRENKTAFNIPIELTMMANTHAEGTTSMRLPT